LRIDAQHQLQGAAFVGKKNMGQTKAAEIARVGASWIFAILTSISESYIILLFDVEHFFIYP